MAYAISTNSLSSALSSYDTYLIKSVTLTSSFLSSSLKISVISRLLIRDIVLLSLFTSVYAKWLIMPLQQSLPQVYCHACVVAVILLLGKIILIYSYYTNKKLVCIAIAALSSCQPSFYFKYTSINIQSSYNVYSVSNTKYIFHDRLRLCFFRSYGRNT